MKKIFCILVTFGYFMGVFAPFNTYIGYLANKEYIIENYCVNKSMPEMDCEGKCYLVKTLAEQSEQTESAKAPATQVVKSLQPHELADCTTYYHFNIANSLDFSFKQDINAVIPSFIIYSPPEQKV